MPAVRILFIASKSTSWSVPCLSLIDDLVKFHFDTPPLLSGRARSLCPQLCQEAFLHSLCHRIPRIHMAQQQRRTGVMLLVVFKRFLRTFIGVTILTAILYNIGWYLSVRLC